MADDLVGEKISYQYYKFLSNLNFKLIVNIFEHMPKSKTHWKHCASPMRARLYHFFMPAPIASTNTFCIVPPLNYFFLFSYFKSKFLPKFLTQFLKIIYK